MVIFGGGTYCGEYGFGDVWALSMGGDPVWTRLEPSGAPPEPRIGYRAVFDSARDRILLFGGDGDGSYLNDVWALTLGSSPAWTELTASGALPSARSEPAATYDPVRDRLLVFGGYPSSSGTWMNDTWELSLGGEPAWKEIAPEGTPPPGRPAVAVYDPEWDRMVVISSTESCGGWGPPCQPVTTWALGLAGAPTWEPIAATGTAPGSIFPISHIVHDSLRNRVIVDSVWDHARFGGAFVLTLGATPEWSLLPGVGDPVARRENATMIFDPARDRILLFGGRLSYLIAAFQCTDEFPLYDDTWTLPMSGIAEWSEMLPLSSSLSPGPRSGHTAVYDPPRDRLILFGGLGDHDDNGPPGPPRNDTWTLSLAGASVPWSPIEAEGAAPRGRWGHTAILDPARERMIVFGGVADDGSPLRDTWALSMQGEPAWTELFPVGTPPPGAQGYMSVYDPAGDRMIVTDGLDTWSLSLAGDTAWSEIRAAGAHPPERYQGSAIYDPVRLRLLLFGGKVNLGPSFNDVWALTLGPSPEWSALSPLGTPPAGRGGQATVYDSARDRMVIYGGGITYDDCVASLCSCSPDYTFDAWALDLEPAPAWRKLEPRGKACYLSGQGAKGDPLMLPAIYDSLRDRMVVTRGRATSALVWGDPPLPVSVDLDPDVVNPASRGRWVTGFVETDRFDLSGVDISTIRLAGAVAADQGFAAIGDHDHDGIPDLMLKFPWEAVEALLHPGTNPLELTGSLRTGERFTGVDRIRMISMCLNRLERGCA